MSSIYFLSCCNVSCLFLAVAAAVDDDYCALRLQESTLAESPPLMSEAKVH